MSGILEKVTVFITRSTPRGSDLLLFRHPYAGIQIPAGSVENGETPEQAARREAQEETGLDSLKLHNFLDSETTTLPDNLRLVRQRTHVYSRPDTSSFDWAYLRRGIWLQTLRQKGKFVQISYEEWDDLVEPEYITLNITGWVPEKTLADKVQRYFFHFICPTNTPDEWERSSDNHIFHLMWAPMQALPDVVHPQDQWLRYLPKLSEE